MQPHRELDEKMKKVVDEDALKMEEGRKRMEIYFVLTVNLFCSRYLVGNFVEGEARKG